MSNRASSFPADAGAPRWYRQRWPWVLVAGPLAVVVASLASAWIAVRSDDGLVAEDYYRQGLLINKKLQPSAQPVPMPGARVAVDSDHRVHVRLRDADHVPARLELTLMRPNDRAHALLVRLTLDGDDWVGAMPELAAGRWIVALGSGSWRLPVTIVSAPFTAFELGGAEGHS